MLALEALSTLLPVWNTVGRIVLHAVGISSSPFYACMSVFFRSSEKLVGTHGRTRRRIYSSIGVWTFVQLPYLRAQAGHDCGRGREEAPKSLCRSHLQFLCPSLLCEDILALADFVKVSDIFSSYCCNRICLGVYN